jgi:hypothetical protein
MENPFKYGGVVRGPYFADRKSEIEELGREMLNQNRVFLVSPRRYGKTCLLLNLVDQLRTKKIACAYIDLNACPDIKSFASMMTTLSSQALETNRDKLFKILSGLQRLRLKVSTGPDGSISAGVELAVDEKEALAALLEGMQHTEALAAKKKRKLVVVIDEFSDIQKYDGPTVEKALRSEIQSQSGIGYIFSGSEQSVMISMVREKSRAFYKMGRILELGPIEPEAYMRFIRRWLKKGGFNFDRQALMRVLSIGNHVPYNIQRLCSVMWDRALESKRINSELIESLPVIIAKQDSPHYEMMWRAASQPQKMLLIALSKDQTVKPFSKDFQLTHGIGPSSSIKASLESLVKKGVLFKTLNGSYRFVDGFMPYWIDQIRRNLY